jgi:V/A-type H+/Na+-transporting ATPase subunit E
MSDELQHLIEKIRAEGVTKADAEARAILAKAREDAARIERDAGEKAAALLKKAELTAQAQAERGRKALEQASRDMVLIVSQAVEALFMRLLQEKVDAAFTPETFRSFLYDAVKSYLSQDHSAAGLELTIPAQNELEIRDFLLKAFKESAAQGVTIQSSNEVLKGFRVAFKDNHVEHDFTSEAITEALARLVRPHLADLLRSALTSTPKGGAPKP